jgi:hypothetical protein
VNPGHQFRGIERLRKIIVSSAFQSERNIRVIPPTGQQDQRQFTDLSDTPASRECIATPTGTIDQERINVCAFEQASGRQFVGNDGDAEAADSKTVDQNATVRDAPSDENDVKRLVYHGSPVGRKPRTLYARP